MFESIPGVNQY